MARPLKWTLAGIVGLIALILLAAVLLPLVVDLRRYGPVIAGMVRQSTGRSVTLGRISFRLLPAPAVTVAPVVLAEGEQYPGRDAVRLQSLSIRLRLWPLLRGRFAFGAVVLDRPVITLIRDRRGRWNYDDVLERLAAVKTAPGQAAGAAPGGAPGIAVDRAEIRGGRLLLYDDAVVPGRRSTLDVGPVEASLTGWGTGRDPVVDLSVTLGKSRLSASARLPRDSGAPVLDATVPSSRLAAADFVTLLPWLGVANPRGLAVGGAVVVDGRARVPLERLESIEFQGSIAVEGLSYKDATMARPLEKIGGRLAIDAQSADWKGFTAALGSSEVRGSLRVENFLRPRIGFDLDCPRIDLNEVIAAFAAAPSGGTPAAAAPAAASSGADAGLLQIAARGRLKVGALRFMTFDLSEVRGDVALADAVLSVTDLQARLYGGSLRGQARLDLSRRTPGYRIEGALEGTDVNQLAGAYDPGLKDLLRGRLGGQIAIDAAGSDPGALLASARGTARLGITQGSITSFSVLKQLAGLLELAGGKGIGRDETPFDSLGGSFAIADRRARTSDLALDSTDLDLTGEGTVGLDAALDLAIAAVFSEEASRGMVEKTPRVKALTDAGGHVVLHLLARGTLAAPAISLDTRAQTRQWQEQKKTELKEKVRGKLIDLLTGKPQGEENPPPPPR